MPAWQILAPLSNGKNREIQRKTSSAMPNNQIIILGIEVYAVILDAQGMIKSVGFISSSELKGVTANRNITAFSIAMKIPFILFKDTPSCKLFNCSYSSLIPPPDWLLTLLK